MIPAVVDTLQRFAAVSGLQVQPHKCSTILLNAAIVSVTKIGQFPVVPVGSTVTYLGIEIGVGSDLSTGNWTRRIDKIQKHIGIASQHTTSLLDRVAVLNSVALPGVLFVAKVFSPSREILHQLDALWRQYLWKGTVTSDPQRSHKIASTILSLPRSELGLGLKDLRAEMVNQAARLIVGWNAKRKSKYWAITHDLIAAEVNSHGNSTLHSFPSHSASLRSTSRVDGAHGLLRLGWESVNAQLALRHPHPPYLARAKSAMLDRLINPGRHLHWLSSATGRLVIPEDLRAEWNAVATSVYAATPPELRAFWKTFPWADNTWIVGDEGLPLRRSDFKTIAITSIDELQLHCLPDGSYSFQTPTTTEPDAMRTSSRERLARWLFIVILNCGIPPHDPDAWAGTRVYSINGHPAFDRYEWLIDERGDLQGTSLTAKWATHPSTTTEAAPIRAHCDGWGQRVEFVDSAELADDHELTSDQFGIVILCGHPSLHHGPTLTPTRQIHRQALVRSDLHSRAQLTRVAYVKQADGLQRVISRLQRLRDSDLDVYEALQSVRLWHEDMLTDFQRIFRCQLILGAHNTRDNTGAGMRCPHDSCSSDEATLTMAHVIWRCPSARRSWAQMWTQWTGRTLTESELPPVHYCLGKSTPPLARQWLHDLHDHDHDHDDISYACNLSWTTIRAILPHRLWLIRNEIAFQGAPTMHAAGIAQRTWYSARDQLQSIATANQATPSTKRRGECLARLLQLLEEPLDPFHRSTRSVRLYYDGGSRGNPGLSGSGAVIIEQPDVNAPWHLVWWDSYHLPSTSTNNFAEHTGLARGLTECARRYNESHQHIDVIGDSLLVTRQLRDEMAIDRNRFKSPLKMTRAAQRHLFSIDFLHTLRTGNTMADWLANHAMDKAITSTSSTSLCDTIDQELQTRLANDVHHGLTQLTPPSYMIPHLNRKLSQITDCHLQTEKRTQGITPEPSTAKRQRMTSST